MKDYIILPRAEDDYHPLSKAEIRALLEDAAACYARFDVSGDVQELRTNATIQIRLGQGIRGATSPDPEEETDAQDAEHALNILYTNWLQNTGRVVSQEMIDDLSDLMNYPEEARVKWAWMFRD